MKKFTFLYAGACLLLLTSCSTEAPQQTKKAEAKPAEPVSGLRALYQMYTAARGWSADIQPLRMNSILLGEVKAVPGRAAAWEVTFVSERLGKARNYTYSVIEAQGNLHKGVFAGLDQSWSGSSGKAKPFLMAAAKIDTDAAYETAAKKAVDYEKKNPGKPISFILEKNGKFSDPSWRVVWGESVGTSNFSIFVDASTGQYLETMR
jgi:hypothetical protein